MICPIARGQHLRALYREEAKNWATILLFSFALGASVPALLWLAASSAHYFLGAGDRWAEKVLGASHILMICFFSAGALPLVALQFVSFCQEAWDELRYMKSRACLGTPPQAGGSTAE